MNTFFVETFNRLFKSKSPAFFIRMRFIFGSLAFANYIPSMLDRWFEIQVSAGMINLCEDIAKYCTGIFAALFLPASSTTVGQTVEGSQVQVTNENKFPFSAAKEKKEMAEEVPPPPVLPDVPETPEETKP